MSKRLSRMGLLAAAALAVLIIPAAEASATPTITSVTQANRIVHIQWSLPAGHLSYVVEMSQSAAVDANGYFTSPDAIGSYLGDEETGTTDTAAQTAAQVAPGVWNVHVADYNPALCPDCPDEWSAIAQIVVPADPVVTPPAALPPPAVTPAPAPPTVHKKSTKCKKGKVRKHGKCVKKKKKRKKSHKSAFRAVAAS